MLLRLNMAALLRSAQRLKISPASLFSLSRLNLSRSPLSRLCSGTVAGRRVTVGPVQVLLSHNVHRSTLAPMGWRHFSLAPEQERPSREESSGPARPRQPARSDWALDMLDSAVRRTGSINKNLLMRIFKDISTGYPSANQALLLLRSCGSLLPEVALSERTALAHQIWDKLQERGVTYDASHYNALLKVYLQNEFKFSPTDFLAKMEAANVQPNRVTYQRLIAAYCEDGDIEGAGKILGFMKDKDMPITEAVFNSLLTGHARAGDVASAESILPMMRSAGIEPGPDTYVALVCAHAEKGDIENVKKVLDELVSSDIQLMDRDFLQVLLTLARAGHHQHLPQILERLRQEQGFVPEAMNVCLRLITQGMEDVAFSLLKTFPHRQAESQNEDPPNQGNFFLSHCVTVDTPAEKLRQYCKELHESSRHATPLQFTLHCALKAQKMDLAVKLMRVMQEEGLPVREHFFWPLLRQLRRDQNTQGIQEVLRSMRSLGVEPDLATYSGYVLPAFPSVDAARAALQEVGCDLGSSGFVIAQVREEANAGNLATLSAHLSSPSFPGLSLNVFRSQLIRGFRQSDDVASMAKITELLYRDERFNRETPKQAEAVHYFLYKFVEGMSAEDTQAKQQLLGKYLQELHAKNITIPVLIFRGIRNVLQGHSVPELVKDLIPLIEGGKDAGPQEIRVAAEQKAEVLEKKLEDLKRENQPTGPVLKQLILALCAEEKLERALELKSQHEEEMVVGGYAALIRLCCNQDNVEEALNLKRELDRKGSSDALTANKYLGLVKVLTKHGRLEEAVDMLKEMKEKKVALQDASVLALFHVLNGVALQGDHAAVRRIQDTVYSVGLAKPGPLLSGPITIAYLQSGDLSGALDAVLDHCRQYKQLPRFHDLLCHLVEKGETELLQKAMDFVSQERGEMTMLYDLLFAFLQTGRYKEARKIIETPGLRARPGRLQWFAEKCISNEQMEPLENLVEMTTKLFECDRDEMYHYMLRLCSDTNDCRKAESAWTKMQEENVIPRERTLRLLAGILKRNGQEVPFGVPEAWYVDVETVPQQEETSKVPPLVVKSKGSAQSGSSPVKGLAAEYQARLTKLCKAKDGSAEEVYTLVKEADGKGVALREPAYLTAIRSLLAKGCLTEALEVRDIAARHLQDFMLCDTSNSLLITTQVKRGKVGDAQATLREMLQAHQVPQQLSLTRLVQALSGSGDVEAVREVEALTKQLSSTIHLSKMLFINNIALAHIKNGNLQTAVEGLEAVYVPATEAQEDSQPTNISYIFRKVIEEKNEEALDKLSAMAERLANQFASYWPVTSLFLTNVELDRIDEARFQLQRVPAIAEQKGVLTTFVTRMSLKNGHAQKIRNLVDLLPDILEKEVVCSYLMKCYTREKDLAAARELYARMQTEGTHVDELTLKRLAVLYKEAGEPIPFEEPLESFSFYAQKLKSQRQKRDEEE
ncbi:leucine-rich PPR motif-containing protein, mitochondrial isoform X1 [Paramormyrops kingsleyae]|uniref:leucine-rich PPR motif-containing protein, mitochondrial isoform X1 n=1 Tax=Paramormyrops kingsleyae TaxID=1676925 RepID=UPI003B9711D7